jgi:hypothetical protein
MGLFERRSPARKTAALLGGIGLGAALMYVLDPERGRRRRAMVRDKAVAIANRTGRAVAARSRDLNNRAKGLAVQMRAATAGKSGTTAREREHERMAPESSPSESESRSGEAFSQEEGGI